MVEITSFYDKHHLSHNPSITEVIPHKIHQKLHGINLIESDLALKMRRYDKLTRLNIGLMNWSYAYRKEFGLNVKLPVDLTPIQEERRLIIKDVKRLLKRELRLTRHIGGFGPRCLGGILAFAHPSRFPSLSKFLAYCGYKNSVRVKKRYSRRAKSLARLATEETITKKDSHYYVLYNKMKEDMMRRYPDYPKIIIEVKARNRVATFLLKEIYSIFHDRPNAEV